MVNIEQQTLFSMSSSIKWNQPLEKSHSSSWPIESNRWSIPRQCIRSADLISQFSWRTCTNDDNDYQTRPTTSYRSNDENITQTSMEYPHVSNGKCLRHRWSLLDIWLATMNKLPSMFNCIWRQHVHRTESREFCEFVSLVVFISSSCLCSVMTSFLYFSTGIRASLAYSRLEQ
jgi:hypothetical protein